MHASTRVWWIVGGLAAAGAAIAVYEATKQSSGTLPSNLPMQQPGAPQSTDFSGGGGSSSGGGGGSTASDLLNQGQGIYNDAFGGGSSGGDTSGGSSGSGDTSGGSYDGSGGSSGDTSGGSSSDTSGGGTG